MSNKKEPKRNPFKQWLDEKELRTFINDCVKAFDIKDIDFSDNELVRSLTDDLLNNDEMQKALRNMVADIMEEIIENMRITIKET